MKAKTELLLYHLLWTCEMLATPTFRNLTGSFEGWAYRNGLHRQTARLERQGLLESLCTRPDDRLCRLTPAGLCLALGHGDPETEWCQPWDGRWRLLLVDVPVNENPARNRLRPRLREHGFGCLQGSVWITPKPVHRQMPFAADGHVDVSSLILAEARPVAGEQDAQIVRSAWDFAAIDDGVGLLGLAIPLALVKQTTTREATRTAARRVARKLAWGFLAPRPACRSLGAGRSPSRQAMFPCRAARLRSPKSSPQAILSATNP